MDVGWSQLQSELIEMIASKITTYVDYIRFRAVCVKWRSTLSPIPHHLPCQFPWLMLPHNSNSSNRRGFFSLSENKVHWLNLPETCRGSCCCGSSQGWVVLLIQHSPIILLFNPLTRIQFQLPPFRRNRNDTRLLFIKKVVLSSSPASLSSDYIIVVILNGTRELAFCKKGGEAWTMIRNAYSYCEDVIYYKGLFYAVDEKGSLAICDVSGASPSVTKIAPPPIFGATDFPGCEGNCIYFTDYDSKADYDGKRPIQDSGVFNVGDGSIKPLPYCDGYSRLFLPPPIWVITSAC
ncbi:Protein of unknown function DUF295 [Macleaya cordata]|uniref:KIB1-4 beta-propeller domain-containing protein n=1 Tax=Macleaya cordata TaxID=56857 RepID=A0A200QK64_MACCD|nr:Protein of unknown function DUF295 [Macleaya cordata]